MPPDDELRRDRAVPVVLLEPERDVEAPDRAKPVDLRALAERDRAAGVAAVLADAEAQVLPLAHRRRRDRLRRGDEERHVGVAETERREPRELLGEVEREIARRHDGVDVTTSNESSGVEVRIRVRREGLRERLDLHSSIESPAAARWPPKRSRFPEHAASAPCRSNVENRAPRALPPVLRARDEHDRAVEALDEARRDDAR